MPVVAFLGCATLEWPSLYGSRKAFGGLPFSVKVGMMREIKKMSWWYMVGPSACVICVSESSRFCGLSLPISPLDCIFDFLPCFANCNKLHWSVDSSTDTSLSALSFSHSERSSRSIKKCKYLT